MASQVSPGVVLRERDLTNAVIVGDSALTAAFASSFQKGPIGEIVSISSEKQLVSIFGTPKEENAEDWMVASEFLGYGGQLAVVRAGTGALNAASGGSGVLIKNDLEWEAGVGAANVFAARTAGSWGNSLKVVAVDRGADQILTLASAPATTALNTAFATVSGKAGRIYSWDAATKELAVILDNPTSLITPADIFDEPGDGVVSAVAAGAYAGVGTQNGVHTVDPTGGSGSGLRVDVTIDAGGAVTGVAIVNGGVDYAQGDTVTCPAANLGTGATANLTLTINTVSNDNIAISNVKDWYTNTTIGSTGLKLAAIGPRPGTSEYASSRGLSYDELHVAVIDTTGDVSGAANTVLERFTYLSKLSDGKGAEGQSVYYKTVLNEESQYIFHGAALANTIEPVSAGNGKAIGVASSTLTSGDKFLLVANNETDLADGADDYAYTPGEVNAAYDLFLDTEETEVDFVLMGGSMGAENDTLSKAQKVVAIAAGRKDCIAFVSPHRGNQIGTGGAALSATEQRTNTLNFFNSITSTSFAVLDSGYKYMYDRFNQEFRYVPMNGDIAGTCARNDINNFPWFSPGGTSRGAILNVVKLAYTPNQSHRDKLYTNRINPVIFAPGAGIILFGDKTGLGRASAFDRINVRRLFIYLEKAISAAARDILFEFNDEITRLNFINIVEPFLRDVQSKRGITDFIVVCDETNNTPAVIDSNEFVADIYIKPARSINFIGLTFVATRTGVSFEEVIGRV